MTGASRTERRATGDSSKAAGRRAPASRVFAEPLLGDENRSVGCLGRWPRQIGSLRERIDIIGLDVDDLARAVLPLGVARSRVSSITAAASCLSPCRQVSGHVAVGK